MNPVKYTVSQADYVWRRSLPAAGVATAAAPLAAAAGAATAPPAGMEANLERPVEGEDH